MIICLVQQEKHKLLKLKHLNDFFMLIFSELYLFFDLKVERVF